MCGAGKHGFRHIFLAPRHTNHAAATALLNSIGIHRLTFNVAKRCHGEDAGFLWNQILNIHFSTYICNFCTAVIPVFVAQNKRFFFYDLQNTSFRRENLHILRNFFFQLRHFFFNLMALQASQLTKTHLHNGLRLGFVKAKALHKPFTAFRLVF